MEGYVRLESGGTRRRLCAGLGSDEVLRRADPLVLSEVLPNPPRQPQHSQK